MGFREEQTEEDKYEVQERFQRLVHALFNGDIVEDDECDDEGCCSEDDSDVDTYNLNDMSVKAKLCALLEKTLDSLLLDEVALDNADELHVLVNVAHNLGEL